MIKIILILLTFVVGKLAGQHKRFLYEYEFVPDSTDMQKKISEIMVLDVGPGRSEFFSLQKMKLDSTLVEKRSKGINDYRFTMSEYVPDYRIVKYPQEKAIDHKVTLGVTNYLLKDDREIIWHLHQEFTDVADFRAQLATAFFAGRKWAAYFSRELTVQDGPYKFRGLPGLIVKLADEANQHRFELVGIENSVGDFVYPSAISLHSLPVIDYNKYKQKFQEYRENPAADLYGIIPDQPDMNGNMKTGTEIWLEISRKEKDRLARDNNILELDLLYPDTVFRSEGQ